MANGFSMLHQVPEGHVGVYWRGGALLKTITNPGKEGFVFSTLGLLSRACLIFFYFIGFHWKFPFMTHFEPIQVTLQTDEVILALLHLNPRATYW